MTDSHTFTTEQKLAAIIDAQAKGGCEKHVEWAACDTGIHDGRLSFYAEREIHVLEILLDPVGLSAAYGKDHVCKNCARPFDIKGLSACQHPRCYHPKAGWSNRDLVVAHMILLAWLSNTEGDPVEAIDTAYSLLH